MYANTILLVAYMQLRIHKIFNVRVLTSNL